MQQSESLGHAPQEEPMNSDYTLVYGTHATADDGRCAMEWVSYLAGEPHSDAPACVSPVLRAFCIALNDGLESAPRQRLRMYLPRTIGTADDGLDEPRAWMAMDWLIRTYTPAWLGRAGFTEPAAELRSLAPIDRAAGLDVALESLKRARRRARTGLLDLFATGVIARSVARETAWASAAAPAWAAARLAVGDIAGDRARAAARAAAGDAAASIVRDARAGGSNHVTHEAIQVALAPTLGQLRESAFELLDRMLPTVALDPGELAAAAASTDRSYAAPSAALR
jgi:hypothetical protein